MQKDIWNTQGIVKITEWSNITQAKECWQPPEVGEDSSTKFPLEPLEEKKPYWHFDFDPLTLILNLQPPEKWDSKMLCYFWSPSL